MTETIQTIGDAQWLNALDLAHELADLPVCDWQGFLAERNLDAELERLVLELAAEFEPVPEFGVGSQLGRYVATQEIARGGTSQIFTATDQELGRNVALKVLHTEGFDAAGTSHFLLREARAASALSHPNIVTIYEVVRSGRLSALAMEYVPGAPLRMIMRSAMTFQECLPIWRQVAKALGATHAAGIAHRDMKPENIMVRPDGLVKVLDFGMTASTSHDSEWEVTSGTPRYMSPEQCRCAPVGVETDIFSLGVVFYEMITGCYPFEGQSAWETMTSIAEDAPEPPSKWNPAVSRQLDALILSMLRKKASDRPSAIDVAESLERLAQSAAAPAALWSAVGDTMSRTASWLATPLLLTRRALLATVSRCSRVVPSPLLD